VSEPRPPARSPRFRQDFGADGEARVGRWYAARGYTVVDRNWRTRAGELDLVLTGPGVVVFCEVKARAGFGFGAPVEAVTAAKQRRIRGLAIAWLGAHRGIAGTVRFDVASVLRRPGGEVVIDVIENAF